MYIVLLGVPGAGKGTQAETLSKKLKLPQISTGDLCRYEMKIKSPIGIKIQDVMDKGGLVSDDIVLDILKKRLAKDDCANGVIFDGVPRTLDQAKNLDIFLTNNNKKIDKVIYIYLDENEILKRLSGRWTCKQQGHIFHEINNPPKTKNVCDFDGSELYQRDDQKPDVIRERIKQYENSTLPLIDYYNKKGTLKKINGNQSIEKVGEDIIKIL